MDYEGLGISRDGLNDSKFCVTASFNSLTSALSLKEDDCVKNRARVICEVQGIFFLKFRLRRHGVIFIRCPVNTCADALSAGNSSVH